MSDETLSERTGIDLTWIPAATTIFGGIMAAYGGSQAKKGYSESGDATLAASERAAAAARDAGVRQAESEVIKGQRAKAAAQFESSQLEQQAGQAAAAAQRDATEQRRQAKLVQSRAIAVAAASGAGASDVSVVNLVSRTAGEGALRANMVLYKGYEHGRILRMQAAAKQYEGLTAEEAGGLNAADALAKWNAAATAEEAKGADAKRAADIAGRAAAQKGGVSALTGILPAAAGLLDKYGGKLFGKDTPDGVPEGDPSSHTGDDADAMNADDWATENAGMEWDTSVWGGETFELADTAADFEWLTALEGL